MFTVNFVNSYLYAIVYRRIKIVFENVLLIVLPGHGLSFKRFNFSRAMSLYLKISGTMISGFCVSFSI